eukprot:gene7642-10402_t
MEEKNVTSSWSICRTNNAPRSPPAMYLYPPSNDSNLNEYGRSINLSDRLLICSSSNMRNEVIVGGSDHALYSINVNDPSKSPIVMYSKGYGHSDWVTTVSHMLDGRVISGGMDGKLCLWSESNRKQCIDLSNASEFPISKVLTDNRYNAAISCSYDGKISIWKFNESSHRSYEPQRNEVSHVKPSSIQSSVTVNKNNHGQLVSRSTKTNNESLASSFTPEHQLDGHRNEAITECSYNGNNLVSGDKSGAVLVWDLTMHRLLHRFRAHPGPITALECFNDNNDEESNNHMFISCGTDGYVKVWDPRTSAGLVHKIPSHVRFENNKDVIQSNNSNRLNKNTSSSVGSRNNHNKLNNSSEIVKNNNSSSSSSSSTQQKAIGSSISCLTTIGSRGVSQVPGYVITSSGSPEDSSIVLLDSRMSFRIVNKWSHHQNGVYSLCTIGDEVLFSGDGVGNLFCYNLLSAELESADRCLQYGIKSSERGAVRSINCLNGKIVTTNEDGNVLIFDYSNLGK